MRRITVLIVLMAALACLAQEQKPATPLISPAARLAAAKTAYIKNGGDSDLAYNVIETALEGWGRFIPADSPEQADVVIEVFSQSDVNGTTISSSDDSGRTSSHAIHNTDVSVVRLTVYDARTHLRLWTASERPKGGFREKTREDHLIEAASNLVAKLRDRLEPPPATPKTAKRK